MPQVLPHPAIEDRIIGMFVGLAIGDALGAAVEFSPRGSFPPVTGYRGGSIWGIAAGEWTDDTSMALALADSILQSGWNLSDQGQRYVSWMDHGKYSVNGSCFDVGMTTEKALLAFKRHGNPRTSGQCDEYSSGNGGLMRLAPIPAAYHHLSHSAPDQLVTYACESTALTHASDLCLAASSWMCLALSELIAGRTLAEILKPEWRGHAPMQRVLATPEPLIPVFTGAWRNRSEAEIRSGGYVVDSLEAALWAVYDASSFESAILRAVNLGEDADTVGAIAGQFAGAIWGLSGISRPMLDGLCDSEMLIEVGRRLSRLHGTSND